MTHHPIRLAIRSWIAATFNPHTHLATAAVLAFVLCTANLTQAQTTWTNGNGTNFWSQSGNWSPASEPTFFSGTTTFPNPIPAPHGTVTLGPLEQTFDIRFDTGGYTLSGGDLNISTGEVTVVTGNSSIFTPFTSDGLNGLTKLGAGVLNLQGNNTYAGPTNVDAGILDISGFSERIPDNSAVTLAPSTLLRFFNGSLNETIGSLAGSGTVVFANSADETFLTVGQNNLDTTFSGNIIEAFGGTGGLIKTGTGILTLSGDNDYTFLTNIDQGTLRTDPGGNSLPDTGQVNLSGTDATLDLNNDVEFIGPLTGNGNLTLTGASSGLIANYNIDAPFSGNISGDGAFLKGGAATLTYSGAATNTAFLQVFDGTMTIPASGSINGPSDVVTDNDAILNADSTSITTAIFSTVSTSTYNHNGTTTLNASDTINVSNNSNFNHNSGTVTTPKLKLFHDATYTQTTGTITVSTETTLINDSNLIRNDGTATTPSLTLSENATFTQADGTTTVDGPTGANGMSTINLNGGDLATDTFTIDPTATFNHTGGTLFVTNGPLNLPPAPYNINGANTPRIQLMGPGTSWNHAQPVTIANDMEGELQIINDATATFTNPTGLTIGAGPSSIGKVLINLSGTLDLINNPLVVGAQGTGRVALGNDANITTGQTTIGQSPGSTGEMQLAGSESSWVDSGGPLTVGDQGKGTIEVFGPDSEIVSTNGATIGLAPGSEGEVTIGADASHWNVSSFLTVGDSGKAQLTLNNDGRVDVAGPTVIAKQPGSVAQVNVLTLDVGGLAPSTLFTESLEIAGHTPTGPGGNGTLLIEQLCNVTVTTGPTTLWPNATVQVDGGIFTTPSIEFKPGSLFKLQNNGALNIPDTTGVTGAHSAFLWESGTVNIATDAQLGNPILPNATILNAGQTLDVVGEILVGPGQLLAAVDTAQIFANVLFVDGGTVAAPTITIGTEHIHALVGHGSVIANIATGTTDEFTDIILSGNLAVGNPTSTNGFEFAGNLFINTHRLIINDADQALIHGPVAMSPGSSINAVNGAILTGDATLNATGPTAIEGNFTNNGTVNGPSAPGEFLTFHDNVDGLGDYTGNLLFEKAFTPPPMFELTGDLTLTAEADLNIDLTTELTITGHLHTNGTLTVQLPTNHHPQLGNEYQLLLATTTTGTFTTLNLPPLNHGLSLDASTIATTGTLTVIPEPTTLSLLTLALLPLTRRRRQGTGSFLRCSSPQKSACPRQQPQLARVPRRVPRSSAAQAVLLILAITLALTSPTLADAKFSIQGSFVNTADTVDINFDLFSTVTPTDPFTLETHHWAGGTNHAGIPIPAGSFDSQLTLFNSTPTQVAYDSEILIAPADFDARISYVPDANIPSPILPSDTYTLRLGVFTGQPLLAGHFAVDLRGPDNDMALSLPPIIEEVAGTTGISEIAIVGPGSHAVSGGTFLDIGTSAGASGILRILDGASVNAPGGTFIALGSPTSTGQLEIGNNNATLNTSTLSIGINGDADVTINTGGKINATGTTTIGPNGYLFQSDGTEFTTASLNFSAAGSSYNHYGGTLVIDGGTLTPIFGPYTIANAGNPHIKLTNGATWDQTSGSLTIGYSERGSLTIESGATLNQGTQEAFIGDNSSSLGTVNVIGPGSTWTHGNLNIANNSGAQLNIKDQARVNTTNANFSLSADGGTTVNVTDPGSLWDISGKLTAPGHFSSADITVEKAGKIQVAGPTTLGAAFGSNATLNVQQAQDGTDAAFTTNGLQIGGDNTLAIPDDDDSVGKLNIQTGGHVTVTGPGTKLWNQGTINLTGGSFTTAGLELILSGATFNHTGGTATINANTFQPLGGEYNINGPNNPHLKITQSATWNLINQINVAATDQGTLTIADGGTAISNAVIIAANDTSQGTAHLSGSTSTWSNNAIVVGGSGQATLLIDAGATMNTIINTVIAGNPTATGQATVTGNDSEWQNETFLVGGQGQATLDINAGGHVTATNTHIALDTLGSGAINVSGTGTTDPSTFTTETLDVAGAGPSLAETAGGPGTLNINTGALAQVTGTRTKVWPQGTIDINGGTFETNNLTFDTGSRLKLRNNGTLNIPDLANVTGTPTFQWETGTLNVTGLFGANLNNPLLHTTISLNAGQTLNVTKTLAIGPTQLIAIAPGATLTTEAISLNNGTVIAPTVTIGTDLVENIFGTGHVAANIATGTLDGNLIIATGPLTLGNPASTDGYNFAGQLFINEHRVILNDADQATLGTITEILIDGSINAINGALLPTGRTLNTITNLFPATGFATIEGNFTNNGTVNGPTASNEYLFFEDDLNGTGNYNGNILLNNDFNPGLSPAAINFNGHLRLTEHSTVHIEVQAPAPATSPLPGVDHDQINITGPVALDGTLNLKLLGTPRPDLGTQYLALDYTTRDPGTGNTMFDTITGTLIATDFALAPLFDDTTNTLTIRTSIPGDLNLDNKVSVADLSFFALNFGTTPGLHNDTDNLSSWRYGDFNTDGQITVADLSLLALNFGFDLAAGDLATGISLEAAAALAGIDVSSIPEPTMIWMIVTGVLLLPRRMI